jgi:cytoplasmic iron level regulating protein YaaA (DUF328/UPF0246 family)
MVSHRNKSLISDTLVGFYPEDNKAQIYSTNSLNLHSGLFGFIKPNNKSTEHEIWPVQSFSTLIQEKGLPQLNDIVFIC